LGAIIGRSAFLFVPFRDPMDLFLAIVPGLLAFLMILIGSGTASPVAAKSKIDVSFREFPRRILEIPVGDCDFLRFAFSPTTTEPKNTSSADGGRITMPTERTNISHWRREGASCGT
jgi:hypothetical protein